MKVSPFKTNAKIILLILFNVVLFSFLFVFPLREVNSFDLCLYKNITGHECWNCGMTHAFLSIIHLRFKDAYNYNHNVIVVFPLILFLYIRYMYNLIKKWREEK